MPNGAVIVAVLSAAGAANNARGIELRHGGSAATPLHWALCSDVVSVLDALIDHGADIEVPGAVITNRPAMPDAVV